MKPNAMRALCAAIQRSLGFALVTCAVLSAGCGNSGEHARNLRLQGLRDAICGSMPYDPVSQACGRRSVWLEADWGRVAYITVYGIDSVEEARRISALVTELRWRNGQDHIPVNLRIYSSARVAGREPAKHKIYEADL